MLEPMLRGVLDTGRPVLNIELTRPSKTDPADTRFLLANYFPVRAPSGEITPAHQLRRRLSEFECDLGTLLTEQLFELWLVEREWTGERNRLECRADAQ